MRPLIRRRSLPRTAMPPDRIAGWRHRGGPPLGRTSCLPAAVIFRPATRVTLHDYRFHATRRGRTDLSGTGEGGRVTFPRPRRALLARALRWSGEPCGCLIGCGDQRPGMGRDELRSVRRAAGVTPPMRRACAASFAQ